MTQTLQQRFQAVRLFDSTHCSCSDALAKIFPGYGGDGSAAGFKVLLSYDYGAGQLHPLLVLPAKCSDQGLALTAAQQIHQAELGIFDKGFYKAQTLRVIGEQGGYFLLPYPHSVSIRQLDATGQPQAHLDLAAHLKASTQASVEWSSVQLGQTELSRLGPVRLIASEQKPANRTTQSFSEGTFTWKSSWRKSCEERWIKLLVGVCKRQECHNM